MQGRYEIISNYFGYFNERRVIATTEFISDAKFICEAMSKALENRPFVFEYRKTTEDYDPVYDNDEDLFTLFKHIVD